MKDLKAFFLLSLIILLYGSEAFSQDRIVLTTGDTIACTINKVTKKYLYYSQNFNGVSSKGKVPLNLLAERLYITKSDRKEESLLYELRTNQEEEKVQTQESLSSSQFRFRLSVSGGLGYLLGDTKAAEESLIAKGVDRMNAEDYYSNLKLGIQGKSSAYFYAFGDYWFGLVYKGFYSNSSIKTSLLMDDGNMYYGKLGERYFVNFVGASFFGAERFGISKQLGLYSSFSVGPAFYRDELEITNQEVLIQGVTPGVEATLGMEYFIKPRLSIGFETSLFSAVLKRMTVTNSYSSHEVELDKENWENLGRLELAIGLIYYW